MISIKSHPDTICLMNGLLTFLLWGHKLYQYYHERKKKKSPVLYSVLLTRHCISLWFFEKYNVWFEKHRYKLSRLLIVIPVTHVSCLKIHRCEGFNIPLCMQAHTHTHACMDMYIRHDTETC